MPSPRASFSPDGRRVVAGFSNTGEIRVWNARTGAVAAKLQAAVGVDSAVFSPDGNRIVTGGYRFEPGSGPRAVRIWDAGRYERLLTLRVDEPIRNLVFTPDGSRLLGLTVYGVRMWDTRTASPPPERAGGR